MTPETLFDLFNLGFRISSRRRGNFDVEEALEVEPQKQELWGSDGKTDAFDDKNFMEREE